jgi:hypothetical protein
LLVNVFYLRAFICVEVHCLRRAAFYILQHQLRRLPVALDRLLDQGRDDLLSQVAVIVEYTLFEPYAQGPAQLWNRGASAWIPALALFPLLAFWCFAVWPGHFYWLPAVCVSKSDSVLRPANAFCVLASLACGSFKSGKNCCNTFVV